MDKTCKILFNIIKDIFSNSYFNRFLYFIKKYPITYISYSYSELYLSRSMIQFSFEKCYLQFELNNINWNTYDSLNVYITIHNIFSMDKNKFYKLYKFNNGRLYENDIQIVFNNEEYFIKLYKHIKEIISLNISNIDIIDKNLKFIVVDKNLQPKIYQKEFKEQYIPIYNNLEFILFYNVEYSENNSKIVLEIDTTEFSSKNKKYYQI